MHPSPIHTKVPTKKLEKALRDAETGKGVKRYKSTKALFEELNKAETHWEKHGGISLEEIKKKYML